MFERLSQQLQQVLRRFRGIAQLDERALEEPLRELRRALLSADVHVEVVESFLRRIRERALGLQLPAHQLPEQALLRIVYEELRTVLGTQHVPLRSAPRPPTKVLLVGLQGAGKTTTTAKLAAYLHRRGQHPLVVAADLRRPAAAEQLRTLAEQIPVPCVLPQEGETLEALIARAVETARLNARTVVLVDSAGRLTIEEALMEELEQLHRLLQPQETLLVCDALLGQEVLPTARAFHERIGLTGVVLTKLDGDARGGAALSLRASLGVPIKFIGVGERLEALEPFHPDRLAARILDLGDVATLLERVQQGLPATPPAKGAEECFTFEDLLEQLRALQRMGPPSELLRLLPGGGALAKTLPVDERALRRAEAIILSMTPEERRNPRILNASRRRRIARGSGTSVQEVNRLVASLEQMQQLLKLWKRGRLPLPLQQLFRQ